MQLSTTPTLDLNDFADGGGQVLASYPTYAEAQQAIDRLAAASFPVQYSEIIGRDLCLVERVAGRMTPAHGSATGAVTGAWFGLLIGLLVGLFTFGPAWLGLLFGGLLIGAVWGGYLAHLMGRRQARLRVAAHAGGQPLQGDGRRRVRRPRKTTAPPELTRRRPGYVPGTHLPHHRGSPLRPLPRRSPSSRDRDSRTRRTQAFATACGDSPPAFNADRRSLSGSPHDRRERVSSRVLETRSAVVLCLLPWEPQQTHIPAASRFCLRETAGKTIPSGISREAATLGPAHHR